MSDTPRILRAQMLRYAGTAAIGFAAIATGRALRTIQRRRLSSPILSEATGVKRPSVVQPAVIPARAEPVVAPARKRPEKGHTAHKQTSPWPELLTYIIGYVLALSLTGTAFALVVWRWLTPTTALTTVLLLGLAQMIVHFRCFLHIDLRRSSRDDLQLILFSTLIIALMVGGTLVVLFNLKSRMM